MLTPLDDSLWHQLPTTFDHVGTSDPRFYDRYWFSGYAEDGSGAFQLTMGAYSNMNVLDAGVAVIRGGRQYNVRASRSLRPRFETACDPIVVGLLEPLKAFELRIDERDDTVVHGTIAWTATVLAEEEKPHFERVRGRVAEDYQRFNQIGRVSGRLEVDGTPLEVCDWWACRDHSWGIRPRIGIREPVTGPTKDLADEGFLLVFLFFSTATLAGHIQLSERGSRRLYLTGSVRSLGDGTTRTIEDLHVTPQFFAGTRRFRSVELAAVTSGGERLVIECDALGPSFAMRGLGYSGGFNDGGGLGVWRGEEHVESEIWDVRDPADIGYPDGSSSAHWHRIQPVVLRADDAGRNSEGFGSLTLIASGNLPQLPNAIGDCNSLAAAGNA